MRKIPFFPLRAFSNRLEGKFANRPWPGHDDSQSIPMRAMFGISMKFASRISIGIMIAQGTITKRLT
jgi:hypothetical protein